MSAARPDRPMNSPSSAPPGARQRWIAPIALTLLCASLYCYGLTTYGLHNWQEGQRALVAREMFRGNQWITPTVHGELYIAKPPMMYWVSMLIGHARQALGATPFSDETEVRLTAAFAATIGVLATFFVARRMLATDTPDAREQALARQAAWWAALGLATGVLYFRSARTGELDILIVPFVVIAIGAIDAARRRSCVGGAMHIPALAVATLAGVGAALTKGPPALLVIALAGYGPIILHAINRCAASAASRRFEWISALVVGGALAAVSVPRVQEFDEWFGVFLFAVIGAALGAGLARMVRPGAFTASFRALRPTHPLLVLGIPLLALWGWGALVTLEHGSQVVSELASAEVENNLRLLHVESPVKNLGFFLYGVAPFSIAAIAGAIWVAKERPAWTTAPGRWTPFIWCVLSFMAFSLFGKGVARYLTPAWPGVAMVGGLWIASWLSDRVRIMRNPQRTAVSLGVILFAAGIGQAWWYGSGREVHIGEVTPREFVSELRAVAPRGRIGTYELSAPALDYYFDERVTRWERNPRDSSRNMDAFFETVASGEYLLITRRESPGVVRRFGSVLERLKEAGIPVREFPTRAVFERPDENATVIAYLIGSP